MVQAKTFSSPSSPSEFSNLLQTSGVTLPPINPDLSETERHIELLNFLLQTATDRIRQLEKELQHAKSSKSSGD